MGNIDFTWFTDGSYFLNGNGKYCYGYSITTPFDVVETASLPMVTSAQQAELYVLTWACTLAKDKTGNIYTNSRYAFRVPVILECCGSSVAS